MERFNNADRRRVLVQEHLRKRKVSRVADLGCGEGELLRYLKNGDAYQLLVRKVGAHTGGHGHQLEGTPAGAELGAPQAARRAGLPPGEGAALPGRPARPSQLLGAAAAPGGGRDSSRSVGERGLLIGSSTCPWPRWSR